MNRYYIIFTLVGLILTNSSFSKESEDNNEKVEITEEVVVTGNRVVNRVSDEPTEIVPFSATINISDIEADAVLDHISELIRDPDDFNLSESDEIKVLELRKEYLSFLTEWLKYYRGALKENKSVQLTYNWMSYAIAIFVHIFLILGLYAGWQEFRQSYQLRKAAKIKLDQQEIQINLNGIAIKTSFLGLIIMVSSLVLYFAFLNFVFPIVEIGG